MPMDTNTAHESTTRVAETPAIGGPFDPTRELFVAPQSRPADLRPVNLRALSRFQRALLVIDGTVTKFIEAYTMEPVDVTRIGQERLTLSQDHAWLQAPAGSVVARREVVLRGRYSGTLYAHAISLIAIDRLPDDIQRDLDVDGGSIGRILLGNRAETRREILWCGRQHTTAPTEAIGHLVGPECLVRTYRVISGGRPIALITERFPAGRDRLPVHD
jgi:chorismate-pyruvate lyase